MIPKVKYYGPQIPSTYAVNMTAAASGSNGITVADDDDIDFGTGDFFIHWEGSLPDWTPAVLERFWHKYENATNRLYFAVRTTGVLTIYLEVAGAVIFGKDANAFLGVKDGSICKLTCVISRETATTAGSATFYLNGSVLGIPVAIPSASTVSASNSGNAMICTNGTTGTGRTASNTISCIVGNFAPTSSEVRDLCTNGIPASWKWGSQAAQTSGALTVGNMYRINTYVAGDDFTNVGAASNASGVRFTATGTTPTTWTNSSSLVRIGVTMALLPDTIPTSSATTWSDTSGNTGGGTLPAAGATKVTIRR